ncbi:flagellar biosynthesis protein FlgD [Paenisporosarcina quisquiliarum]|uniref:Flagellar biosynthesis protein FlgD n=2 Tax=Paenisporosarcina TaxID=651660 RepID=A0A9X3LFP0_9BACL|nr:flagellar hook capping FlgD N-terminal domain-containing protein [Paenisporosarcina quisquiliarum]MCZ8536907.1 flagellar biosynthesis protein FlgD [Paenisporosarcina quisquiliarum]
MNVNSSSSVSMQTAGATKQTEPQNGLGKDAFMKILVTQMKNQNPLEPLKDTEFIGQMAQFSSLEQLTNLNQAMTQFVGLQGKQSLSENADLIGNTVYWEQEVNGQLQSGEGIVKALAIKNGELIVELENDNIKVPIDSIHRIEKQSKTINEQEIV